MRLTALMVTEISLVKRPANRRGVILRTEAPHQNHHFFDLTKADARWQRLYGIVYAPNEVDTQGDWADAETIRRAADDFMRSGRQNQIDREHDFEVVEAAFVAESWLTKAGDPLFPEDPEGTWAVGVQIDDPDLWAEIEAGAIAGLSLAGMATLSPEEVPPVRKNRLLTGLREIFRRKSERGFTPDEDDTMTADEVRALVREVLADARKSEEQARQEAENRAHVTRLAAENEALKADVRALADTATALKVDLEALKAAPTGGKGQGEGTGAPATPASFV